MAFSGVTESKWRATSSASGSAEANRSAETAAPNRATRWGAGAALVVVAVVAVVVGGAVAAVRSVEHDDSTSTETTWSDPAYLNAVRRAALTPRPPRPKRPRATSAGTYSKPDHESVGRSQTQ